MRKTGGPGLVELNRQSVVKGADGTGFSNEGILIQRNESSQASWTKNERKDQLQRQNPGIKDSKHNRQQWPLVRSEFKNGKKDPGSGERKKRNKGERGLNTHPADDAPSSMAGSRSKTCRGRRQTPPMPKTMSGRWNTRDRGQQTDGASRGPAL